MVRSRWSALFALAALSALTQAQISVWDQVRARSQEFREKENAVGVSVAVVVRGRVVYSEGFGWADQEQRKPATGKTIYRLASISKPLSAIGLMRLVDAGKADLKEDIRTYVPSWPDKGGEKITLWHILTHTSGIRHYVSGKNDDLWPHFATCTEALKVFAEDELAYPTGSKKQYSTHAWTLLGAAIEGITGKPYSEYINEIFQNARADSLRFEDITGIPPQNRSKIYGRRSGVPFAHPVRLDHSWKGPGGGLESNPEDLGKFIGRFLDAGVVKAATVKQMLTSQESPATPGTGLGWGLNGNMFMHSGSQQGASTFVCGFADSRTVIVVLSNTEGTPCTNLAMDIAKLLEED